ncbi:helix-turn-helix transcriptional regulator [Pelotomaculum propionicicum]|uniref:helix-turn-helix transcriptional regulator n=1 Tax=Pelotomaculum propionicicum TaxID=258475 RepID=UPI003B77C57F
MGTLFKYKYNPQTLPVEKLQERIHIVDEQLADPAKVSEIFTRLVQSLRDCCRVKIWYYVAHNGQNTQRVVEPYGLVCKRHNWYLVAYCLRREAMRVFRVDQITDIVPYTSERFDMPADFSLKEHMGQSWGIMNDGEICRVRLKFSPQVAHRVKRLIYHPSQEIEDEPADGSVIMSFEVCGIDEMKTWLVQWGDTVEVLEPGWLRQDMYEMAGRVLELYKV